MARLGPERQESSNLTKDEAVQFLSILAKAEAYIKKFWRDVDNNSANGVVDKPVDYIRPPSIFRRVLTKVGEIPHGIKARLQRSNPNS